MIQRGHHDMGGQPAGKVELTEHGYEDWERRVDALMMLCSGVKGKQRHVTIDELRKNIETLTPGAYDRLAYYEKWITALTQTMIQRGLITSADLTRKMHEVEMREQKRG